LVYQSFVRASASKILNENPLIKTSSPTIKFEGLKY